MKRIGIDPRSIKAIVLSHLHADHVTGLPLFIQSCYILNRRTPLTIFAPGEAIDGLRALFDLTYLYPLKIGFPIDFVALDPREGHCSGAVKFRPVPNRHLERHLAILKGLRKPNRAQCYSFVIETGRKRMVYSADVGSAGEVAVILSGAKFLVVEASHVDFSALGAAIQKPKELRILITHVGDEFDYLSARRALRKAGVKEVALAREGQEWTIE
jgi:ribonuclease BN (tRNA processing enzyme)